MDFVNSMFKTRFFNLNNIWSYRVNLTQERMFLLAAACIVSAMGTFVLWGPSHKKRKKIRCSTGVKGLVNFGQTCFLNTLLQAVAASPSFCEWLSKHKNESNIAESLNKVADYVNCNNNEMAGCPKSVISAMSANGWTLGIGQQDSHELFFALMACLEEETCHKKTKTEDILKQIGLEETIESKKDNNCDNEEVTVPLIRFIGRTGRQIHGLHHRIDFPFRGQQLCQLICTVCTKSSTVKHQAFDCLSLSLPTMGSASLYHLLNIYTGPEDVTDVHCENCTSIKESNEPIKTTFIKQTSFGKLPKCLCIHIQRTSWLSYGEAYKRHDFVSFPEYLIMDKFTYYYKERIKKSVIENGTQQLNGNSTNNCKHVYKLQSVIVHLGEASSGHFLTYRRPPPNFAINTQWVYVSDEDCQPCTLDDVLKKNAYMLIYEKC